MKNRIGSILMALVLALSLLPAAAWAAEDVYAGLHLVGTPSDYSDADNWLAIPEITKAADTIYFYPTAYNDPTEGVADICTIDNAGMRAEAQRLYGRQATAFEDTTNVFAPYYRQSNIFAVMRHTDDAEAFQKNEQRTDVFAALDYYFAHYNNGRPFILAGHSQGSMMIRIVLDEYMPLHPELAGRMIAAYAIGESFPKDWLAAHPSVKFAEGAEDTGVIVSWNTEGPGNKDANNFVVEAGTVSINPINWKRDNTYAPASENLGSRSQNEAGEYVVTPGLHDAQLNVERGVVVCTTSDSYVPLANLFGPESLHGVDFDLYYENIRQNAKTRVNAYLAEHGFSYGSFTDLAADAWYREAVEYALKNGIMHGNGDDLFRPNDTVTFEQVGQMLLNMGETVPEAAGASAPSGAVSRERLVTLLWTHAKANDVDVSVGEDTNILSYTDALTISEFAVPAMQWAVGAGVINGSDGMLSPKAIVTRAQAAAIFMRYAKATGPIAVIDMEHHYYAQAFLDAAEKRAEVPRYDSKTREIEYVDGVVMNLAPIMGGLLSMDDERIAQMDAAGITAAMLETSPGLEQIGGAEGVALCKACNDLVYETMQKYPGRFYGSATLPVWDVEASVAELERCVKEYGFVSWHTHSNYGSTYIDDEVYRPILKKCAELGVYVYIHPTMPTNERLNERGVNFSAAGLGFTLDTMTTITAMITRGVFDEIPDLKVVSGHFGEALPFLLTRMDFHFGAWKNDPMLLNQHDISYYFKHNIWVTTSGNMSAEAFKLTKEVMGIERIMVGTDHPYENMAEEMAFLDSLDLTRAEREALYYKNAEALMGVGG